MKQFLARANKTAEVMLFSDVFTGTIDHFQNLLIINFHVLFAYEFIRQEAARSLND